MKLKLLNLFLVLAGVFAPIQSTLVTAAVLIAVDLISGLAAARKQKIPISSAGFGRTITKSFVYLSAICLGFIVQKYLMNDALPMVSIISSYIGFTELLSCLENINIIGGGDLLKNILDKLSSANAQNKP